MLADPCRLGQAVGVPPPARPTVTLVGPEGEAAAAGVVIVLDVIRAFAATAAALAAGATEIWCVAELSEARTLRRAHPDVLLCGEDGALAPADFDYGNSPHHPTRARFAGRTVVQRTSNGTRGLARATRATALLAAGATTVSATAAYVVALQPEVVTVVCTDVDHGEDAATAEHLARLLVGEQPDPAGLAAAVRAGGRAHIKRWAHQLGAHDLADFRADVEACAAVDAHRFAMPAERLVDPATGLEIVVLRAVHV